MSNSKQFNLPDGSVSFGSSTVDGISGTALRGYNQHEASAGRINRVSAFAMRGAKAAATLNVEQIVQDIPTAAVLPGAAGLAMTLQSDIAADAGAVLVVEALGANYAPIAQFQITCNGTTPVSVLAGTPITRFNVVARFSGDIIGTITFKNGANTYAAIGPGQHVMRSALFTVPANYRGYLYDTFGALTKDGGTNAVITYSIQLKPAASTGYGPLISFAGGRDGNSLSAFRQHFSRPIVGPVDIRMTANPNVAGTDVQTYLSGIIEDFTP